MNTITLSIFLSLLVPALEAISGQVEPASRAGKLINILLHIAQAFQGTAAPAQAASVGGRPLSYAFGPQHTATVALSSLPHDMTPHGLLAWADANPVIDAAKMTHGGHVPPSGHASTDAPIA